MRKVFVKRMALAVVLVLAAEILRNPTQLGLAYMLVAMACFGVFVAIRIHAPLGP